MVSAISVAFTLSSVATVLLILSLVAVRRALVCSAGWRAWVCYQIAALHNFFFTRCRSLTPCTYPEEGPGIIVANHTCPVDPMILWHRHFAHFRKPRLRVIGYMMAREYYVRGGLMTWVCKAMESIPVGRDGKDMAPIREALRRLKDGKLLGLFPEGRINFETPETQLRQAGTGVAWLALRSQAPVIPVFIRNAPRSRSMIKVFFVRTRVELIYGPPIDLNAWNCDRPDRETLEQVTDLIMSRIAELGGISFTPCQSRRQESLPFSPSEN